MALEIRQMTEDDGPAVLALLNEAFGRARPWSWFEWKHKSGPWGPSTGWVAADGDQVAAARLFLPWEVHGSVGLDPIPVSRAVDGAVAEWARRRGLFSKCVAAEMQAITLGHRKRRIVYSTSVPASREAYRKLGWTIWEEEHFLQAVLPTRGVPHVAWLDPDSHELEAISDSSRSEGSTSWTADSIRWRIHHESGHDYRVATLRASDSPQGLVARRTKIKGIPTLVVVKSWGQPQEVSALVQAAALRWHCPLKLEVKTVPARVNSVKAGASTVSAWTPPDDGGTGPRVIRRLQFDFADLEGVM